MFTGFRPLVFAAAPALLLSAGAQAAEFWLVAKPTSLLADGAEIPMWGFAKASREQFGRILAGEPVDLPALVPGPPLKLPAGDTTVTIHLLNQLPQPVSLILHGRDQGKPLEAPALGGLRTYSWSDVKPGSFLYESASDPTFQVQMGLYGPLVADAPTAPLAATRQFAVVFGELEPGFHDAAKDGQPPASALNYQPALLFAEPMALDGSPSAAKEMTVRQGEPVLLRLYNAGLKSRAPVVSGHPLSVLAADANPLPFPTVHPSVSLPAGGTKDVLLLPHQPGRFALTDHAAESGTWLVVEPAPAPQAAEDSFTVGETSLKVTERDKGVLANDSAAEGVAAEMRAVLISPPGHAAAFTLNADGTFTYTPEAGYGGTDGFRYVAMQDGAVSGLAQVSLAVTAPPKLAAPPSPRPAQAQADVDLRSPQTNDHTFTVSRKQALSGVPLNILAHAKTPNPGARLDPATIMVTRPANGGLISIDRKTGLVTYKAPQGMTAADSFLYAVKDTAGKTSNASTITVAISP